MPPDPLADEARRHDAAMTPGEWYPRFVGEPGYVSGKIGYVYRVIAELKDEQDDGKPRPNSQGIAFARNHLRQFAEAVEEVARLRAALTPSAETKAAYMGEFYFDSEMTDDDGYSDYASVVVPWTTVKEIMAAILARAALAPAPKESR